MHGDTRRVAKTIAEHGGGGSVLVEVLAVHAHACPYWRIGRRHGACTCGALDLWALPIVQDTRRAIEAL